MTKVDAGAKRFAGTAADASGVMPDACDAATAARGDAADARRCRWCQRPLTDRDGPGRPREYCRQSCRQRDYEARRRADERGLDEGEIIVTRARLDRLQDRLWVLSCAITDVEGDLARSAELDDYRSAVAWLLDAAKPVVSELDA